MMSLIQLGSPIEGECIWKELLGEVMTALWQGGMTTVVSQGWASFGFAQDRLCTQ